MLKRVSLSLLVYLVLSLCVACTNKGQEDPIDDFDPAFSLHNAQAFIDYKLSYKDGLAMYEITPKASLSEQELVGSLFFMPYPHASGPAVVDDQLIRILVEEGYRVYTFDPPGNSHSYRVADLSMEEMIAASDEVLEFYAINKAIPFVGHDMGALCALAFGLNRRGPVSRLLLVGAFSGWKDIASWRVASLKELFDARRLQRIYAELKLRYTRFTLYDKLLLDTLTSHASYYNKNFVPFIAINADDKKTAPPVRSYWLKYLQSQKLSYQDRLGELEIPVLLCAGRHDRVTLPMIAKRIASELINGQVIYFENSGHNPHIEQEALFRQRVRQFLLEGKEPQAVKK